MKKHLKIILKKMCKKISVEFEDIDFKKPNWYWDFSWTKEKQDEFKVLLINYLKENKEARKELMVFPSKNKKQLERLANEFLIDWGWREKTKPINQ